MFRFVFSFDLLIFLKFWLNSPPLGFVGPGLPSLFRPCGRTHPVVRLHYLNAPLVPSGFQTCWTNLSIELGIHMFYFYYPIDDPRSVPLHIPHRHCPQPAMIFARPAAVSYDLARSYFSTPAISWLYYFKFVFILGFVLLYDSMRMRCRIWHNILSSNNKLSSCI